MTMKHVRYRGRRFIGITAVSLRGCWSCAENAKPLCIIFRDAFIYYQGGEP